VLPLPLIRRSAERVLGPLPAGRQFFVIAKAVQIQVLIKSGSSNVSA